MRVLICEPHTAGHHLHYVSLAARAARRLTDDVVVGLSSEAPGTFWHQQFIEPIAGQVRSLTRYPTPPAAQESRASSRLSNRIAHWAFLERYIRHVRPDHVILPTADRMLNVLCVMPKLASFGAEIEAVVHASPLARLGDRNTWRHRVRNGLMFRAPAVSRLHFTDATQYAVVESRYPSVRDKCDLLPDAIEMQDPVSREEARRTLGLDPGRRIALMISPAPFKGAVSLLNLFQDRQVPSDCQLVLAGTPHAAVQRHLEGPLTDQVRAGNIVVLDGRRDEIDLHYAICAADLVVVRLTAVHGTSAMCLRAAAAGRRFFSASSSWMDMMARDLNLGDTFDSRQPGTLPVAFARALERSSEPINEEVVRRLRRFHSEAAFIEGIGARLRARLGLPSETRPDRNWLLDAVNPS